MKEDEIFWLEHSTCDKCGKVIVYDEYYYNGGYCNKCEKKFREG